MSSNNCFQSAKPIWIAGRETEMNVMAGFRAVFPGASGEFATLNITASSRYRVWLNGVFVGHGPARGPHGWHRVDTWDLSHAIVSGDNLIAIEAAGYNLNSYYVLDQPSFVQAEVLVDGAVAASTAGDGARFVTLALSERVQKVQRYSYQRAFSEVYRIAPGFESWRIDRDASVVPATVAIQPDLQLLPHRSPLPVFDLRAPVAHVASGTVVDGPEPESMWREWSADLIGPKYKGYPFDTLETTPSVRLQRLAMGDNVADTRAFATAEQITLVANSWRIVDMGVNLTGFIALRVSCAEAATLTMTFDEVLTGGDVDFKRPGCVNIVEYELAPGEYNLETFEPYTLRYLKLMAFRGTVTVAGITLRELACPDSDRGRFSCSDPVVNRIFEAARETLRQNAVDVFMDCPSRERAGWLCDSFFTARVAADLSGHTLVEDAFIENFLLPPRFPHLPDGMLPMCYPSDHPDGNFIPNWALWFVIQLEEYRDRGGDEKLIASLENRVSELFNYFAPFENEDGLLEKLDKWIFVEWSRANDFVQDVNYPSNMLYAAALDVAARLYGRQDYASKAALVRAAVRTQSFDGEFFVDNAVREGGRLSVTRNRTETCQYYAFFFGTASPESHPELWRRLSSEFGPSRASSGLYAGIHPANAFIGHYLRLELLSRYGFRGQILREMRDYFGLMAEQTGTLWEHDRSEASCNHGFASHVAHVLLRDILGIGSLSRRDRTVRFDSPDGADISLDWCEGSIPVDGGEVSMRWERAGEGPAKVSSHAPTEFAKPRLPGS